MNFPFEHLKLPFRNLLKDDWGEPRPYPMATALLVFCSEKLAGIIIGTDDYKTYTTVEFIRLDFVFQWSWNLNSF